MLKTLLPFVFVLVMIGVFYVLFMTQIVDRIMMRLRFGKRANSIESTMHAVDDTVRRTVVDLHNEKTALEAALKKVTNAADNTTIKVTKTVETHPFVIRTIEKDPDTNEHLYWSNALGWTDVGNADRFDNADKLTLNLPVGGRWLRQRKPARGTGVK